MAEFRGGEGIWRFFGDFFLFIFFLGGGVGWSPQDWTILGVLSMHFRVFPLGQCTVWGFFWVAKILNILLVCLIFLICFGGKQSMLGPSLRYENN